MKEMLAYLIEKLFRNLVQQIH